jgi:PBP1b-binding outer membrane lipoprotein LpoB
MKKLYALILVLVFLSGCVAQPPPPLLKEKPAEEPADISQASDISEVGTMDEELDAKSLETLEEDLGHIENIR